MKSMVCLVAILGAASAQGWHAGGGYTRPVIPAPLAHDGRVLDTPEINQAKAAHFAAHEAAISRAPNRRPAPAYNQEYIQAPPQQASQPRAYYPQENNQVPDYDSYEDRVSEEKNEPRWRGPLAKIEFTPDGKFIKDTPEVQHARAQHLAALSEAKQKAATTGNQGYEGAPKYGANGQQYDDGQYREEGERSQQYTAPAYPGGSQYGPARAAENDGQYREGDLNGQYSRNWNGQGAQGFAGNNRRSAGYY